MTAYFDNSATTKPCKTAIEAVNDALNNCWGNPSSLHQVGLDASNKLKFARKQVSKLLGVNENTFYFTHQALLQTTPQFSELSKK